MKITNLGKLPSDENKIRNHKGKLPSQKRKFPSIETNKNMVTNFEKENSNMLAKGYKIIIQRF